MERPTRPIPRLTGLAAVLLLAALAAVPGARASSAGVTGWGACTNLAQYNHTFLYVSDGPKSDRVSIQVRPIGFYLVQSTQYGSSDFSFYQNEYDVFLELLEGVNEGYERVTEQSLGQVSYDPRLDLAFGIEEFTGLKPNTPYTAVQHAGNRDKPVSRICFRTAADS